MLELPAKTIYVDPRVRDLPNCRCRYERMRPLVRCGEERELNAAAREVVDAIGQRRHGKDDFGDDAVVVFTAWREEWEGRYYHFRNGRSELEHYGNVCQDALELNTVFGCHFRCAYCGFGRAVEIMLDIERFLSGIPEVFARYPDQRLYKYSNMTDLPPLEPEYDAVLPMVSLFAREQHRYLMLFTKSDNVEFLLDTDSRGHTIVCWSLSSRTVSREIDRRTAPMERRIEAMRRCQQAGYGVRARISPIVPIVGWREEYRDMFERMFAAAKPDLVTLEMLGWFDFEDLARLVPMERLDARFYKAAEEAQGALRGKRSGPFPFNVRREVYEFCIDEVHRLSPRTPVSICHGTPSIWQSLGPKMGMDAEDFVCNCGGMSAPGNRLMTCAP